ncbi:hypothetical protein FEF65_02705 [Mariprofundus erugo]|uniref:Uncharacterized protein n=1 Tax=Mariprofundus erugo TaxID=2528639 RepID=A0A5R9GWQ5_9PROT|nr:hypothetical protein [Mariprofundus erugo]TLS68633.1 hypothetical protein FEF65_02705 [Mariprofundus erugo]
MGIFDTIWRRKGRPPESGTEEQQEPGYHITMTDRDYSAILEDGDVALKFWLPELLGDVLDQNCNALNTTRSDLVRQIMFTYLYGKHDWMGFYERREHHYLLNSPPLFSRQVAEPLELYQGPNKTKDLGKNIEDLKVWIPRKMRDDIQTLAGRVNLSLSEMIREIIISTLFGHTYLNARGELLQIKIEFEEKKE